MKKQTISVMIFIFILFGMIVYTQTLESQNITVSPFVKAGIDLGLKYDMYGMYTSYTTDSNGRTKESTEFDKMYSIDDAGKALMLQAGYEIQALALWQKKGLVGGELYIESELASAKNSNYYTCLGGFGGTILYILKFQIGLGYSSLSTPIDMPDTYNIMSDTYGYKPKKVSGFCYSMNFGVDVPVIFVENVYFSAYYKYTQTDAGDKVDDFSKYDKGFSLCRHSIVAGFTYNFDFLRKNY